MTTADFGVERILPDPCSHGAKSDTLIVEMGLTSQSPRLYSWDDYRTWDDGERWELIDGHPFCMSPAPASRHQAIVSDLHVLLHRQLEGSPCRTWVSPIDVKLSPKDVVQPDIVVICDRSQIRATHIEGPPALVVEVLSPSTGRHDRVRKLRLYARSGVREYWLVQPHPPVVEVLKLDGEDYRIAGVYTDADTLHSPSFPELRLELAGAFTLPVSPDEHIDEIRETAPPYGAGSPDQADAPPDQVIRS